MLGVLVAIASAIGLDAARAGETEEVLVAQAAGEGAAAEAPREEPVQNEPEAEEPETGTVPPGVEVLQVKGRGAGAIEAEVPSSLTLFDAATIEALGAQDISDLSRVTPNVNIVQPGSTQATFFVRGVGLSDFSSNAAGAVTIFQDDVSINAPAIQTGQLYDVEGIEVMRGPQGTGPFRNASAGAIRVRSRRPTGNYSAQLRTSIGRYDTKGDKGARDAMIQDYEGAVEMPIVADLLSSRFAFRLREADPYKTNRCARALPLDQRLPFPGFRDPYTPDDPRVRQCGEGDGGGNFPRDPITGQQGKSIIPVGLPWAVNDEHNWAARGTLRLQPRDSDVDFFLNAHGSRLDQDSTLGQAIGTDPLPGSQGARYGGSDVTGYIDRDVTEEFEELCGRVGSTCTNTLAGITMVKRLAGDRPLDKRPYQGDYNRVGRTTRDAYGGFVSGEGNVADDIKLSALTSYDQYERFQENDTDFTPGRLFELVQDDEAWQMYHQLQLEGELGIEPIQWNLGVYYLEEHLDNDGTLFVTGDLNDGTPKNTRRIYSQNLESFGAWGGFVWDFADDFTLEGGVRYNYEKKKFDFTRIERVIQALDDTNSQDETWQTPTGQIVLSYHIDEEKSIYARYARGFKAGHFNALASGNLADPPADEEYNDSWETGLRGTWFNRRLALATSFFYYRYSNYQVFLFIDSADASEPPVLAILNAKQAENFGIEVEGSVQPLEGWAPSLLSGLRFSGNFSWLHGEYIDFASERRLTTGPLGISTVPIDYSGQSLQNAPEYKASATAEWTFDIGRFGYIIPRYDVNWSDDVFFDPNEGRGSVDPTGGPTLPEYGIGQKQYFLHNVRLAYRTPTGNVELAGWIRNVEDQVYKNFAFDASGFTRVVINFAGEPRTYGFDVSVTF